MNTEEKIKDEIKNAIRAYIKYHNITIKQFAERCGYTRDTVNSILNHETNMSLITLCKLIDIGLLTFKFADYLEQYEKDEYERLKLRFEKTT